MLYFFSLVSVALLLVAPCLAAPVELGLKFSRRAGALPSLILPYGTWQASSYDPNGDVRSPSQTLMAPSPQEWLTENHQDLYLQEHSLCRASSGRLTLGQACPSSDGNNSARWVVWACLCPSAYQRASAYRSWCKLTHWVGLESVPCRHSHTFIQGCL